jgi:hypothetical protein
MIRWFARRTLTTGLGRCNGVSNQPLLRMTDIFSMEIDESSLSERGIATARLAKIFALSAMWLRAVTLYK